MSGKPGQGPCWRAQDKQGHRGMRVGLSQPPITFRRGPGPQRHRRPRRDTHARQRQPQRGLRPKCRASQRAQRCQSTDQKELSGPAEGSRRPGSLTSRRGMGDKSPNEHEKDSSCCSNTKHRGRGCEPKDAAGARSAWETSLEPPPHTELARPGTRRKLGLPSYETINHLCCLQPQEMNTVDRGCSVPGPLRPLR